jgi:hypothetical protein
VTVTAGKPSEYAFRVSPRSVKHGTVVFKVTNLGKLRHSFVISGHATEPLRPHQSATLKVVFKKPARYIYSDTCLTDANAQEMASTTPCPGGVLKVT